MKLITEEQRQALIARLTKIASWDETYGPDHNVMLPASEAKEMAEAYIAALTADVFMHGISDPDGKAYFSEYCVDDDGSGISDEVCALNDGETDFPGGYSVVPLYTAPPVPMIDLPKYKSKITADCTADVYFQGKGDGWNECLAEIKRLNRLGE